MSENTKDNILEFFVTAANKHDFELDISLLVHGAIVTGTLISATEYFENMSQSFEDGSDISQKVSQQLSEAGESADSGNQQEVNFIHLKNTKIYCGDSKPTPSKGEILWRGKLEEVDSFFLGRIAEPKSKSKNNDK
ncbi:gas vesicle accessory protein GvpU [Virgibacillus halodenitrificans]|uniref:Gas vesicle protein GvpU n=1 Tax=Virgibacillus halodenitrificans TaxID=1482 RepID=A0ABR7VT52_VIRHA|nr:gas vesicle accessory protein GvpU [Virgibacillus halodenitrificans]MBD1224526.1 gas vesicle protein GvpU [Virgibacillus halodenitrificans]MCG1028982.1 gas vesicle protein GvpU [Virgibacillus halodenitrificans]MEC2160848.1 gas vesicle protein GvpU [Virgibacillus halodenitrificans]MYL45119.1 gas vesicle protein GvpU [Virgibacillus halodenitrificans]MYL58662.1 gas vesicle protein GvpU [Virgibacillus halodenitrificans]